MNFKTKYDIGDIIYNYKTPSYDLKDIYLEKGKIKSITKSKKGIIYITTFGQLTEKEIFTDLKELTDFVITRLLINYGELLKK